MLSLEVSWWGKSRFVAYVTRGPLNYAHYRRDMIGQLGRHRIACVFVDYFEFSRD